MRIHHQNMKYLCSTTEAWIQENLSYLGIDEFCCNFIDLQDNTYLPLTSGYGQYCDFMEKKLHHDMASRIRPGIRHWNPSEVLFQVVESHFEPEIQIRHQTMHALDWTVKTRTGFEMFCVVGHRPLQPHQINAVKHWMNAFSYEGAQIKQNKPKVLLEIENREALEEQFMNFDALITQVPVQFQKAQFGTLVLTSQEQKYIQHLILQRPNREIAAKYQVSEAAVRQVIHNIKYKLGCPNMSTPHMLSLLHARGALEACRQTIQEF